MLVLAQVDYVAPNERLEATLAKHRIQRLKVGFELLTNIDIVKRNHQLHVIEFGVEQSLVKFD